MNGRRFTFSAGFGLDAEAMRLVDEERAGHHELRRPNDLRVVAAAIRALRADGWSLPDRATLHDGEREIRCSYVAVANANPYTYFGPVGVRATPRASFDAGLDVVAAGNLRTRDLWRLGVYGLVWPRHATGRDPRVAYLHDRSALTLVADQTVSAQVDGEYVGPARPGGAGLRAGRGHGVRSDGLEPGAGTGSGRYVTVGRPRVGCGNSAISS